MKHLLILSLLAFTIGCTESANKKVLIYNKNGEGFIHDNIESATTALKELCDDEGIAYDVSEDPSLFTEDNLKQYDVLIFNNTNNDVFDTDEQRLSFRRYIQAGGGFVGIHSACGSERNWPWFWAMMGGKFIRHCPYQEFGVNIIDHDHPSTAHFTDRWEWEDEGYYMIQMNPGIHVLMVHDMTTIEDTGKVEYPGEVFGDVFPGAWYHEYDGGREWYTSYGHHIKHYADPDFRKHLIGGILWALEGGKPDFALATATDIGPMLNR